MPLHNGIKYESLLGFLSQYFYPPFVHDCHFFPFMLYYILYRRQARSKLREREVKHKKAIAKGEEARWKQRYRNVVKILRVYVQYFIREFL